MSLSLQSKKNESMRRRWTLASLLLHAAVLVLFLAHSRPQVLTAVDRPGDSAGRYFALNWNPGGRRAISAGMPKKQAPPVNAPKPNLQTPALTTPETKLVSETAHGDDQSGENMDSLGTGEIVLALTTNHPSPKPTLPHGTHGDVVIDIVIDMTGHVAQATLVRGLGPAIDNNVLAAVQQWTFSPARRDGQPITSEQELLFHYDNA